MYRLWEPGELERVLAHPEMTAAELAAMLPGRTAKAVRRIRERHGRHRAAPRAPLCAVCGARPVYVESRSAGRLGLCQGCYADEVRRRAEDRKRLNAARRQLERAEAVGQGELRGSYGEGSGR